MEEALSGGTGSAESSTRPQLDPTGEGQRTPTGHSAVGVQGAGVNVGLRATLRAVRRGSVGVGWWSVGVGWRRLVVRWRRLVVGWRRLASVGSRLASVGSRLVSVGVGWWSVTLKGRAAGVDWRRLVVGWRRLVVCDPERPRGWVFGGDGPTPSRERAHWCRAYARRTGTKRATRGR